MLLNNNEYFEICSDIKNQIRSAQHRAMIGANRELIMLYWNIGNVINVNSEWGNKFIENLARDIKLDFPDTTGFSVRNLKYMAKFSSLYSDIEFVQTVSAQLSWSHNVALLDKVKDDEQRAWYAKKAIENGWSINVMVHQIESMLYNRQVLTEKTNNFETHLPSPQSELAQQALKDPSEYQITSLLPNELKDALPSAEDIEKRVMPLENEQ